MEASGNFAILDSYVSDELLDEAAIELSGHWHAACLSGEPLAGQWQKALVVNYTSIRGYQVAAELECGVVLFDPARNDRVAITPFAVRLSLVFDRGVQSRVPGGALFKARPREYNLELDDAALASELQETLRTEGRVSLLQVAKYLGISDCMLHPEALGESFLVWDKALARTWSKKWTSALLENRVFVPDELEPYVVCSETREV